MTLAHFFPGNWPLHCSKLCPKPSMPYYAHEKGPSTMAGPQRYEISLVSSTKGCSKQICLLGVGFSLCRVVFALGQAKFCVFANFIRIARLFWHFSHGNWLLSLFSCVVFKRMQKNVKLARGLWLLNVPVLINFPCGKRKKTDHSHRHLGFLAFSGSISPISPCHCKCLSNVIFLKY